MPNTQDYVQDMKEIGAALTGKTAPKTGEYYTHIYSGDDPSTGVPTLGVELTTIDSKSGGTVRNTNTTNTKQQANSNSKTKTHTSQNTNSKNLNTQKEVRGATSQDTSKNTTSTSLPLGGIFTIALLIALIGFVYFILRAWQDHKARMRVMLAAKKPAKATEVPKDLQVVEHATTHANSTEQLPEQESVQSSTQQAPSIQLQQSTIIKSDPNWRIEIEQANNRLLQLLEQKGIAGETIADKLKAVKPGQFSLADMAWEAQNGAKQLLTTHDSEVSESAVRRTLQFFTQVFEKNV